jgi:hypothetical protein
VSRHIKGWARGHGFSLLAENDKDVKTVQSLTRHANSRKRVGSEPDSAGGPDAKAA